MQETCIQPIDRNAIRRANNAARFDRIEADVRHFDSLSDEALIDSSIVESVYRCSEHTRIKFEQAGKIPLGITFGVKARRWPVGVIRADLARKMAEALAAAQAKKIALSAGATNHA